ncbi:MAG: FkbM family methyltransferase [Dysgonomonas sp.]
MAKSIKKIIFKTLSLENYLRLLQRSYFVLYKTKILKNSPNYSYHYYAKNLIRKGDTVIDIGANLGYYSILFSNWVGEKGKVYSVEPIAVYNKIFNEKAKKHKNITLYPYALGLEEKKIELVSSPKTGYLSTGLPHVYDSDRDGRLEDQEFRFQAEMKIPSELFEPLDRIDYIKCDIEGFEYVVLNNMKDLIDKHKPIVQAEVWGDNETNVNRLFKDMGYIPHKLKDGKLTSLEKENQKINGDYVYIHKDSLRLPAKNRFE